MSWTAPQFRCAVCGYETLKGATARLPKQPRWWEICKPERRICLMCLTGQPDLNSAFEKGLKMGFVRPVR